MCVPDTQLHIDPTVALRLVEENSHHESPRVPAVRAEEINHALENGIATRLLVLLPQFLGSREAFL